MGAREKAIESEKLTARQHLALEALLAGGTPGEAAKVAGVHATRISEWGRIPLFARLLADGRAERRRAAIERLDALVPKALEALAHVLAKKEDGTYRYADDPKALIAAAKQVLDRGGVPVCSELKVSVPESERPYRALTSDELRARLQLLEGGKP